MRHALVEAFERASRLDYSIKLRPDHVWLAIVQALAMDLAPILRPSDADAPAEDWLSTSFECGDVLPRDRKLLAAAQNAFSTTDRDSLAACRVCLLSGARHRFDPITFRVPCIVLEGTDEDWASIQEKLRTIEKSSLACRKRAGAIRGVASALAVAKRGERRDARVLIARLLYELSRCAAGEDASYGESSVFAEANGKRSQITGGFIGVDVRDDERSVEPIVRWRAGAPEPSLEFFPSVDEADRQSRRHNFCFCL